MNMLLTSYTNVSPETNKDKSVAKKSFPIKVQVDVS